MSLDMHPKTKPRPVATRAFKALLPKSQLKRLGTNREISTLLASQFKGGTIDRQLEYLGYAVVTKRCGFNGVAFYATGYRNNNTWEILSVLNVAKYQEITRNLQGEPMVKALVGHNMHASG